ncbi:MAG: outer rane autotransporter barrel domain protein [Verrucomicrobiales bacterium]|nr:outer rane autotransporter barrel domain protein [Verrucomicrobiales bacterium]
MIFGKTVPYVNSYTGQPTPGAPNQTFTGINKLAIDAEGLALKPDGSGYVSDEDGANVYYFNANKEITAVITLPAAVQPHTAGGDPNFISTTAPADGRRNNQGLEGVALSPDGSRLFTLLQSGTVQDSGSAQQNRLYTRLTVYDVAGNATPDAPLSEFVLQLPTYTQNGGGTAVNATAAQSEIISLDNNRLLVLSRDGNGQGSVAGNPSVYKSVLLVDLNVGAPTDIAGTASDGVGGLVTTSPGMLNPAITQLSTVEALNMLNNTQLDKFNISLDLGGPNQVTQLTLGEKWEGMSLVSANDPAAPDDYFLFIANDNDFLTSDGQMVGPGGTLVDYNAFVNHPANRLMGPDAITGVNQNDTMFLAYRVTIATVPEPGSTVLLGLGAVALATLRRRRQE